MVLGPIFTGMQQRAERAINNQYRHCPETFPTPKRRYWKKIRYLDPRINGHDIKFRETLIPYKVLIPEVALPSEVPDVTRTQCLEDDLTSSRPYHSPAGRLSGGPVQSYEDDDARMADPTRDYQKEAWVSKKPQHFWVSPEELKQIVKLEGNPWVKEKQFTTLQQLRGGGGPEIADRHTDRNRFLVEEVENQRIKDEMISEILVSEANLDTRC